MDYTSRRSQAPGSNEPLRGESTGATRRSFLIGMGAATAGAAIAGPAALRIARLSTPSLNSDAPTGSLPESEAEALLALLEVLVTPEHAVTRSESLALLQTATRETPGLLDAYAEGARLLDRLAVDRGHARFAAAPAAVREAIVDGLLWRYGAHDSDLVARALRNFERFVHSKPRRRFRELVVRDLLLRHHRRHAWRMTGYRNHPGVPADAFEYTRPPSPTIVRAPAAPPGSDEREDSS
jgi:hypothetical protein